MNLIKCAEIFQKSSEPDLESYLSELVQLEPDEIWRKLKSAEVVPVLELLEYVYRIAKSENKTEEIKEVLGDAVSIRNPLDPKFWENLGEKVKTALTILRYV